MNLHKHGFIHRDLKPENFLIGLEKEENLIYIIDFGLSRRYRDIKTGKHIPKKKGRSIVGTVRYVSINTHLGEEQSRRDDMESLGYIIMYLLNGFLPWQGLKAKSKEEKYKMILSKKFEFKNELLNSNIPVEFKEYFNNVRNLDFEDEPNYSYLIKLFLNVLQKEGFQNDSVFEWCKFIDVLYLFLLLDVF